MYEYHDYGYLHEHWYAYPSFAQYPVVAEGSSGVEMTENCRYCYQPLMAASDRRVDYCPTAGGLSGIVPEGRLSP